jgi:Cupin
MLHPGAERLILFHVVASGRCWVSPTDGERYWASAGEVIVLPYGDAHLMGGVEPAMPVPITTVVTPPPWDEIPVIRHGAGGARTDIVCGFLYSEDPLFEPSLRALPPPWLSDRRPVRQGVGSTPASRTPSRDPPAEVPARDRRSFPNSSSWRFCGCTSPTLPPLNEAGSPLCTIPFSPERWRRFTAHRKGLGRWRTSQPRRKSRAHSSTLASGRYSAGPRSVTSPSGACTSREDSCRHQTTPSHRSLVASAMNPKKRLVERSSASAVARPRFGARHALRPRPSRVDPKDGSGVGYA